MSIAETTGYIGSQHKAGNNKSNHYRINKYEYDETTVRNISRTYEQRRYYCH